MYIYFKHPNTAQTYRQMTGVPKSFFKEVFNPFWDTLHFVEKPYVLTTPRTIKVSNTFALYVDITYIYNAKNYHAICIYTWGSNVVMRWCDSNASLQHD